MIKSSIQGWILALALALAVSGPARAWSPPPGSVARSGDLQILQIATTDPEQLMRDWQVPTDGASLITSTSMARNTPIVTFLVFGGCKPDATGVCNLTVDFETIGPGGKVYDSTKGAEVWVGHPAPPPAMLQLSVAGYGLRIEDNDQLGAYHVRAVVTDHVAGVTVRTEQTLTATER